MENCKFDPNLAVSLWIAPWSDEQLLKPIIEDFKRYCPTPVSAEAKSLLDKICRLTGIGGPRLPRQLGMSFLRLEKNERPERQGSDCRIC